MIFRLSLGSLFINFRGITLKVTFSALDGAALHFYRSMRTVQTVVEPAGVANSVSGIVSSPEGSDG